MKKLSTFSKSWLAALAIAATAPGALAIDINDEAGLKAIAQNLAGDYTLTADITLTGDWTPLGSSSTPFTGTLNGNGHVIKNVVAKSKGTARQAFINSAKSAEITKLGLENVDILGGSDVGGLLGKDMGDCVISECYVTGFISGLDHTGALIGGCENELSVLENCYAIAYVYSDQQAGGLVGTPINLEISNCYFAGSVHGDRNCMGGIASLIDGGDTFSINNCFVAAPILVKNNMGWGSTHRVLGNDANRNYTISNSYALDYTLIGSYEDLNTVESDDPASMEGASKSIAEMITPQFAATLGWDPTVWTPNAGTLPTLKWQKAPANIEGTAYLYATEATLSLDDEVFIGVGTVPGAVYTSSNPSVVTVDNKGYIKGIAAGKADITVSVAADASHSAIAPLTIPVTVVAVSYTITTPEQLNAIRFDLAGEFTLGADIDMAGFEGFQSIGTEANPFTGKIHGDGHVIKNLSMDVTGDNQGFIGTAKDAEIDKIGFENARVVWTGNGGANVAVIVGRAMGTTISNSYVTNSYVEGRDHTAAIVGGSFNGGESYTLVEDCYSNAEIYSKEWQGGGIMGTMVDAKINRCHFSGIVNTRTNTNGGAFVSLVDNDAEHINAVTNSLCLAIAINASATGSGRIIGNTGNRETTMENNYGLDQTQCSGSSDAEQATTTGRQGESVDENDVRDADFYTDALGWDMENTWKLIDDAYPVLAWQELPVNGKILGLPETITLIEGKGAFSTDALYGNLGFGWTATEVGTNYLRIKADISVKSWPAATTTTYVRFESDNADIEASIDVPVVLIPLAESMKHISTPAELMAVNEDLGLDYILDNDIDMAGIEFKGIGSAETPFTGVFDGAGHIIANISVDLKNENKRGGLFNATQNAQIKRLGLVNVEVLNGAQDAAGMVGYGRNTTVDQCFVTGYINGNDHVGGFFGNALSCRISNSYVDGKVITRSFQAGGISGVAAGTTVTNCYVTGEVRSLQTGWACRAAGIIGMLEGTGCGLTGVGSMAHVSGGIIGRFVATADGWNNRLEAHDNCVYHADKEFTPGEGWDNPSESTSPYEITTKVDDNGNDWATVNRVKPEDARTEAQLTTWATYSAIGWDNEIWKQEAGKYPTLTAIDMSGEDLVESTTATVNAYGTAGAVVIDAATEAEVAVYSLTGALAAKVTTYGTTTVPMPAGIYVVAVATQGNAKAFKVIVK